MRKKELETKVRLGLSVANDRLDGQHAELFRLTTDYNWLAVRVQLIMDYLGVGVLHDPERTYLAKRKGKK
jgi:hypothetical protein